MNVGRAAACPARRVCTDRLDPVVWAEVRGLFLEPAHLAAQLGRAHSGTTLGDAVLEQQAAWMWRLAAQYGRLLEAYQQGVTALDEFAVRGEQLQRQRAEVAAQLDQLGHARQARAQLAPASPRAWTPPKRTSTPGAASCACSSRMWS